MLSQLNFQHFTPTDAANKYMCCQHLLKGRLYSHSTVQTTLSQQNLQHFKATDAHTCTCVQPTSLNGRWYSHTTVQGHNSPAEHPTLQTNRCGQQDDTVFTQYGLNNALPAELPTLQTNRCAHMYLCAANISEWKMVLSHNSARTQLTRRTSNTSNQPMRPTRTYAVSIYYYSHSTV